MNNRSTSAPVEATGRVCNRRKLTPPRTRNRKLTLRERQVLSLVGLGKSGPTVEMTLGISGKTVESHLTNSMRKLKVHNRAALVREAIRLGLSTCPCHELPKREGVGGTAPQQAAKAVTTAETTDELVVLQAKLVIVQRHIAAVRDAEQQLIGLISQANHRTRIGACL